MTGETPRSARRRNARAKQLNAAPRTRCERWTHAASRSPFQAVAQTAGVSRQWLYTQPDLRAEIEQLRDANSERHDRSVPARERASENSLRHRNRALLEENQLLRAELTAVKNELAVALGELRDRQASERRA